MGESSVRKPVIVIWKKKRSQSSFQKKIKKNHVYLTVKGPSIF